MTAATTLSRLRICSLALVVALTGCDDAGSEAPADAGTPARPEYDLAALPFDTLSEYGFFVGDMADEVPAPWVLPYTVISPLWADHAFKGRFVVLPEGGQIDPADPDHWRLPVGSIIIKSFSYSTDLRDPDGSRRLIETRLLIHEAEGWTGHTYLWDAAQTEAVRHVAGRVMALDSLDEAGAPQVQTYILPNTNQCKNCHEIDDALRQLALNSRQMYRPVQRDGVEVDQVAWLQAQGALASEPTADDRLTDPMGDGPLDRRARSYLDANCGHCHRPGGGGGSSGLVLLASETRPSAFGVCKSPVAAGPGAGGRTHDITPGAPDESIFIYRMSSTDPEIKMPEIPNLIVDEVGVALISAWIAAMEPPGCD